MSFFLALSLFVKWAGPSCPRPNCLISDFITRRRIRVDWSSFCIPQQLSDLKADNQRLKDENGALIRVISKLSRPPTWPSSLGHNTNDWKRLLRLISTAKAVVAVFSWSLKLYLFIQYETTTQRFVITLGGRGGRSPAYFFFLCRYVYVL